MIDMLYYAAMEEAGSKRIETLRAERRRLLAELPTLPRLLRASYFERFSTCSRPSCPCHQGQRHGPRAYVAATTAKTQHQHYVPQSQQRAARQGIRQYRRLLAIVDRVTAINLELLRGGVLDEPDPG